MRILFALNTLGFGGAEVFTARLANALTQRGHKIFVYVHNYGFDGLNLLNQFDPSVSVSFFHRNRFVDFLSWKANALLSFIRPDFREWIKERWIMRFIKKDNIQIVSSQGIVTDVWFSKMNLDIPVVSTIHEDYEYKYRIDAHGLNSRVSSFVNRISHFIYLSEASKDFLQSHYQVAETKFTKIYNGFPYSYQNKVRENSDFVFGMIARGTPEKGWLEAIEAFQRVFELKKNIKLILIGGKDYFNDLKIKYTHLPISFIESTTEPLSFITNIDVGLLPSYVECLPNFVVECLSLGKPVIATNVGEIEAMVSTKKGKAGQLIPLHEGKPDVAELTNKMLHYLTNVELYKEDAANTEEAFQKFLMQKCIDRYMECFSEQLQEMGKHNS